VLGYLPAVVLAGQVPTAIAGWMLAGGIVYTIGVVLLMNDAKTPYLHAGWHLMVMLASAFHFYGMLEVVSGV
jgi:hemolysin III